MLVYFGEPDYVLITAEEGTGDNLLDEDIKEGLVDYYMSSMFNKADEDIALIDSAQIMTTKLIKDMDEEEQIKTLRDYWELTGDYVILERQIMRFYIAEREALEEARAAETIGDLIRIGFNRVDFKRLDGYTYECWEFANGKEVQAYRRPSCEPVNLPADIKIDRRRMYFDKDEDGYTIVEVEEKEDEQQERDQQRFIRQNL